MIPIEALAEKIGRELNAPLELVELKDLPPRMTLVKRPVLERQRRILGVTPKVSLDEGVALVCRRVRERIQAGEGRSPIAR